MSVRTLEREEPNYFGAGPALLPTSVLQEAAYDMISYEGENLGVGEISHRSKPAIKVIDDTKAHLKELLSIPDTHEVFFMQGGGTTGFSSIAYNLIGNYVARKGKKGKAAYAVTGSWSKKSAEEAVRLGFDVDVVVDTKASSKFTDIPPYKEWKPIDAENTSYLYVCDNETVNGTEFQDIPEEYLPEGVELVADMSSNILSKKIDVSKYGLIMAGAQKNVGLAGITIYIIKKSLIEHAEDAKLRELGIPLVPIAFHYPTVIANNSAYNTIPIFTTHILKLVLAKLIADGGIEQIQKVNAQKASLLYTALDQYPEVFNVPVAPKVRSKMNVVFTLKDDSKDGKFISEAAEKKLTGLKGHRSVGGMRASIYNAVTLKSVELLVEHIHQFANGN